MRCSTITLPVPTQQIKNTLPSFYDWEFYSNTSLSSHFSLPSFKKQRKNNLRFERITSRKKLTNFDFRHLYWRFNIMLAGYFFARKISNTLQLWAVRFSLRREAGMAQTAFAYVWALNNTYLKLHHKETTVLSRVHQLLLTVLCKTKKILNPKCHLSWLKKPKTV